MDQLIKFFLISSIFLSSQFSYIAIAEEDLISFSSPEVRERYLVLTKELRCPKCQNQNLADSNSMISVDLRQLVYRLLEEGKSDDEIVEFLVARYGDFVRYRPPIKNTTLLLWGLPLAAVLIIIFSLVFFIRHQRKSADSSKVLAEDESKRLNQLLSQAPNKSE